MFQPISRTAVRQRIHRRIRRKVAGSPGRLRLNVFRSLQHIYAQIIDDAQGRTLVTANSLEKDFPAKAGGNVTGAREVGKRLAARALAQGIQQVAMDRGGFRYHGRVKALAESAREGGLKF